jgi:hypothetical protein
VKKWQRRRRAALPSSSFRARGVQQSHTIDPRTTPADEKGNLCGERLGDAEKSYLDYRYLGH